MPEVEDTTSYGGPALKVGKQTEPLVGLDRFQK
jgi:hypothetical protein